MEMDAHLNSISAKSPTCDVGLKTVLKGELTKDEQSGVTDPMKTRRGRMLFPVTSSPPWPLMLLYAIQQVLSTLGGPVSAAFVIRATVCAQDDKEFLSQLICTSVFMNGLCTFLQVTIGIRLPIIQGSTFTYIAIMASMMATPEWRCPKTSSLNSTNETLVNSSSNNSFQYTINAEKLWRPRMLEASGSLIAASAVQVLVGGCGLVGFMMRFIGPLTIAPTVMFVGLSLTPAIIETSQHSWGVAMFTVAIFLFSLSFLGNVGVPIPSWKTSHGCQFVRYPLFKLFPQIIAIGFGWCLCGILTSSNFLTSTPGKLGYRARTDINLELITQNDWFFIPYPCMWGRPTVSLATFFGMLAATISSIIESVGDYYATARACNVPPPPKHAMNRGIAMEGIGSLICGLLGAGHATTSYSETVGFIAVTGMASRRTWQLAGCIFMAAGIFGKFAAVLACIPDPVIGGLMIIGLGMVVSVGLSTLQFIDLTSSRNHIILGISILLGTVVPTWIKNSPDALHTGNKTVDQILTIFLSTAMFIGGVLGFILDNLLPGTKDERGLIKFSQQANDNENICCSSMDDNNTLYNLPSLSIPHHCTTRTEPSSTATVVDAENNKKTCEGSWMTYLPFLPEFQSRSCREIFSCFTDKYNFNSNMKCSVDTSDCVVTTHKL